MEVVVSPLNKRQPINLSCRIVTGHTLEVVLKTFVYHLGLPIKLWMVSCRIV
jgi:hypothetical protein